MLIAHQIDSLKAFLLIRFVPMLSVQYQLRRNIIGPVRLCGVHDADTE